MNDFLRRKISTPKQWKNNSSPKIYLFINIKFVWLLTSVQVVGRCVYKWMFVQNWFRFFVEAHIFMRLTSNYVTYRCICPKNGILVILLVCLFCEIGSVFFPSSCLFHFQKQFGIKSFIVSDSIFVRITIQCILFGCLETRFIWKDKKRLIQLLTRFCLSHNHVEEKKSTKSW